MKKKSLRYSLLVTSQFTFTIYVQKVLYDVWRRVATGERERDERARAGAGGGQRGAGAHNPNKTRAKRQRRALRASALRAATRAVSPRRESIPPAAIPTGFILAIVKH